MYATANLKNVLEVANRIAIMDIWSKFMLLWGDINCSVKRSSTTITEIDNSKDKKCLFKEVG